MVNFSLALVRLNSAYLLGVGLVCINTRLVVKSFFTSAKCFFIISFVNDGLVSGWNAANRKFGGGIFDASFMEFSSTDGEPFAS